MRFHSLLTLVLLTGTSPAQTNAPNAGEPPKPATSTAQSGASLTELQKAVDQLTQSNHDLLDLLKKQQAVLQDMQYDRRLQSRQIQSLEERLEETLTQNTKLQSQVAGLEAAAARPAGLNPGGTAVASTNSPSATASSTAAKTPPPPSTYLPAPDTEGVPGTLFWHRLLTLKGSDSQQSDIFAVQGKTWRVIWHNQDPEGKVYKNTSALFINAFPNGDTIPVKVCSKLGSGGDTTELNGPGTFYLKVEASGGTWELAVEDFR